MAIFKHFFAHKDGVSLCVNPEHVVCVHAREEGVVRIVLTQSGTEKPYVDVKGEFDWVVAELTK